MAYKMNTTKTWAATYRELGEQFQRWGYHRGFHVNWSVENLRGYRDVTLRYQHANEPEVVLTMKNHPTAEDNLRVLYLAVESLRMNEVRGISDVVRAAYLALPAPAYERDPYEVLQVRPDSSQEVIKSSYRALTRLYHPDSGTSPDAAKMTELNAAYERVKAS